MRKRVPLAVFCVLFLVKAYLLIRALTWVLSIKENNVLRVRDVYSGGYILKPDNLCKKGEPFLLVVVVSSPQNYYQGGEPYITSTIHKCTTLAYDPLSHFDILQEHRLVFESGWC